MNKFQVCIRCVTYNHSNYIVDAMNGFCIQETNFPYVCCIIDDASTDNEQNVIKNYLKSNFQYIEKDDTQKTEYGELIVTQHKTNNNCYFAVLLLRDNHYQNKKNYKKNEYIAEWLNTSPYIAMCEGDDYWTDPLKLQKQVDFLECHPDYVLCCHRYTLINEDGVTSNRDYVFDKMQQNPNGFSFNRTDNLNTFATKTPTVVYRNGLLTQDLCLRYKYYRDTHMMYHLLSNGLGYCLPFYGAVVRTHSGGVWSHLSYIEKLINSCKIDWELYSINAGDEALYEVCVRNVYELACEIKKVGNNWETIKKLLYIYIKYTLKLFGVKRAAVSCFSIIKFLIYINYTFKSPVLLIRKWNRICSKKSTVCPTQYYEYYKHLFRSFYAHPLKVLRWRMMFHYVNDGRDECIIPLIINDKRKMIRGISNYGRLDYEDIISSTDEVDFLRASLLHVFGKYVGYKVDINNINENGELYKVLQPVLTPQSPCVAIDIDNDYETYYSGLSKHQRQNIRTAYNRLRLEEIELRLEQYDKSHPIPKRIWNQCEAIYENRHDYIEGRFQTWWNRITNPYHWILVHEDCQLIYVLYHNQDVVAYMAGLCANKTFYVPRLCINNKYSRYSPGIILVNETIKNLIEQGMTVLDLMLGDELYKLAMGGHIHQNYMLNVTADEIIEVCTPQ